MNFLNSGSLRFVVNYFNKGHERSIRAKQNILSSLFIKGAGIFISFITLPITLSYVDSSTYGVWLTLSSIVGWFVFFDIGLTAGLRNRFAEALARGEHTLARVYVSTTYAIISIIFVFVWAIFIIANNLLDWVKILNVADTMRPEVTKLAIIVFTYFCMSFILRIITTILLADQYPARSSFIDLLGQILTLILIIILVKTTEGSLIKLGLALCISPLVILLGANIFFYNAKYKKYSPRLSFVKFTYARDLFNIGLKFFVIQVAGIIQFQTANIIIARNFGAAEVTAYNVVYKLFGALYMIFNIFLIPFWSASTEAYQKHDIKWIKNGIKKYSIFNILMTLVSIVLLIFSDTFYRLWLGEGKVFVLFSLSFWGFVYSNIMMFGGKYVQLLNGISALRIQFIASLISPILFILVVMILINQFNIGVQSLFIGSIIANINGFILAPLQYHMVVNRNKKGIWIR